MSNISDRIRVAFERSGLTLREVEEKTGISRSTFQRYTLGKSTKIPLNSVDKIARALNVTVEYIMGWEDTPKNAIPIAAHTKNTIPLIGTIACGTPILAEENVEEMLPPLPGIHADMALRAKGDSMVDAGIFDGDIVYIMILPAVDNGTIAAIRIGDEATIKRCFFESGKMILHPENKKYQDMIYQGAVLADIKILGRVVGTIRKF